MAKKITPKVISKKAAGKTISTPVRNSAIPKKAVAVKKLEITSEQIAVKAFEIHASGNGGSEQDNWFAAERELRGSAI